MAITSKLSVEADNPECLESISEERKEVLKSHHENVSVNGTNKKNKKKKKRKSNASSMPKNINPNDKINSNSNSQIWSDSNTEKRSRLREFWVSLSEDERRELVKLEKNSVLQKMKEQQKQSCSCSVCGRKRNAIEEELEAFYDAYYAELERFAELRIKFDSDCSEQNSDEDNVQIKDEIDGDHSALENPSGAPEFLSFGNNLIVKSGALTVADELLKDNGNKFIDIMDQLAEWRSHRENYFLMDSNQRLRLYEDELYDDNPAEDPDDEFEENEDEMILSNEQRMTEGRRMFQIFAARMFEQRVLQAYKERIASERQKQLLAELEEECRLEEQKAQKKAKEQEKKREKKERQRQARGELALKQAEKEAQEKECLRKEMEQRNSERLRLQKEAVLKTMEGQKVGQDDASERQYSHKIKLNLKHSSVSEDQNPKEVFSGGSSHQSSRSEEESYSKQSNRDNYSTKGKQGVREKFSDKDKQQSSKERNFNRENWPVYDAKFKKNTQLGQTNRTRNIEAKTLHIIEKPVNDKRPHNDHAEREIRSSKSTYQKNTFSQITTVRIEKPASSPRKLVQAALPQPNLVSSVNRMSNSTQFNSQGTQYTINSITPPLISKNSIIHGIGKLKIDDLKFSGDKRVSQDSRDRSSDKSGPYILPDFAKKENVYEHLSSSLGGSKIWSTTRWHEANGKIIAVDRPKNSSSKVWSSISRNQNSGIQLSTKDPNSSKSVNDRYFATPLSFSSFSTENSAPSGNSIIKGSEAFSSVIEHNNSVCFTALESSNQPNPNRPSGLTNPLASMQKPAYKDPTSSKTATAHTESAHFHETVLGARTLLENSDLEGLLQRASSGSLKKKQTSSSTSPQSVINSAGVLLGNSIWTINSSSPRPSLNNNIWSVNWQEPSVSEDSRKVS